MRRICIAFVLLTLAGACSAESGARGTIIVHVTNFRSDRGHARIGLFNQADGFPMDSTAALTGARVAIANREATARFDSLPYGTYAVIAHHDENDNYKLDVNWIGVPREMYGASNNPKARLGPPRFRDSRFELHSDSILIEIKLHN